MITSSRLMACIARVTPDRLKQAGAVRYMETHRVFVVKAGNPKHVTGPNSSLQGLNVVVQAGTKYEEYLKEPDATRKKDAEENLAELRGPAKTGEEEVDNAAAKAIFLKGAAHYEAGRYGHAYDEFTKAYGLSPKSALVFSRAQALRKLGGRRDEAIALYEEYLTLPDITRRADAEFWLGELKHSGAAP